MNTFCEEEKLSNGVPENLNGNSRDHATARKALRGIDDASEHPHKHINKMAGF